LEGGKGNDYITVSFGSIPEKSKGFIYITLKGRPGENEQPSILFYVIQVLLLSFGFCLALFIDYGRILEGDLADPPPLHKSLYSVY
jgi:hypothetical protein